MAVTFALMAVPVKITALVLLSSEYPMDAMACEEHGEAVALSENGDDTVALLVGVETVTEENAGAAHTASAGKSKQRAFMQVSPNVFRVRVRLARSRLAESLSWANARRQ